MNTLTQLVIAIVLLFLGYSLYTTISESQESTRILTLSLECKITAEGIPQDQRDIYLKTCIAKKSAK